MLGVQRAIEVGADFIEGDVEATKDGKLICFHDVTLDATTNVANLTQFAGRNRTYSVEGQMVSGYFVGPALPCPALSHLFRFFLLSDRALNDSEFMMQWTSPGRRFKR